MTVPSGRNEPAESDPDEPGTVQPERRVVHLAASRLVDEPERDERPDPGRDAATALAGIRRLCGRPDRCDSECGCSDDGGDDCDALEHALSPSLIDDYEALGGTSTALIAWMTPFDALTSATMTRDEPFR